SSTSPSSPRCWATPPTPGRCGERGSATGPTGDSQGRRRERPKRGPIEARRGGRLLGGGGHPAPALSRLHRAGLAARARNRSGAPPARPHRALGERPRTARARRRPQRPGPLSTRPHQYTAPRRSPPEVIMTKNKRPAAFAVGRVRVRVHSGPKEEE